MGLDHGLTVTKNEVVIINFDWRKQNHIHQWFVDRAPDGDNGEARIFCSTLVEFYDTANTIIKSLDKSKIEEVDVPDGTSWQNGVETKHTRKAVGFVNTDIVKELMPPAQGFFFGSVAIDEYYQQSLEDVKARFKPVIEDMRNNPDNYVGFYSSWW